MKSLAWMACAAAFGIGPAAAAQDEAISSDARCIAAFGALIQIPAYKDAAGAGLLYFLGRLDARDPKLDLVAAVRHETERMDRTEYMTEAQRCGALLKQRGEALKAAGQALASGR